MNYLAHFHLAGEQPAMIKGALLGDFVKGPLRGQFDAATERGIELHRKIDAFSAGADEIKIASRGLAPELHRYAGIITDVVFDFFLSRHWSIFHGQPLADFAQSIYGTIELDGSDWPIAAQHFRRRLVDYNLLCRYGDWSTVDRVLCSIAERLSRDNPLGHAAASVKPQLDSLESGFLNFYPKIQHYSETFIHPGKSANS
jgi:acyl carrier protein phosphodiesterase